jgi:hypothetical protein
VRAKFQTVNSCERIGSPEAFGGLRGSLMGLVILSPTSRKIALSFGMGPSFRPFRPIFSDKVSGGIPQTLAKKLGAEGLSFDRASRFPIFFSLSYRPLNRKQVSPERRLLYDRSGRKFQICFPSTFWADRKKISSQGAFVWTLRVLVISLLFPLRWIKGPDKLGLGSSDRPRVSKLSACVRSSRP